MEVLLVEPFPKVVVLEVLLVEPFPKMVVLEMLLVEPFPKMVVLEVTEAYLVSQDGTVPPEGLLENQQPLFCRRR